MTSDLIFGTDTDEDMEAAQEQFLSMVCRVLIRLENDKVFDKLKKTEGFSSVVVDHEESIEDGFKRLNRFRNS